jgi:hypothetical protein
MSSESEPKSVADSPFDGTFDGTMRRQILLGLELDYTARLRWLERTMRELVRLRGLANSDPR